MLNDANCLFFVVALFVCITGDFFCCIRLCGLQMEKINVVY